MNQFMTQSLLNGNLILFIGAGASFNSSNRYGENIPLGNSLAELLCKKANISYNNENLSTVYSAVKGILGEENLHSHLEEIFKYCNYSDEYKSLAQFPFKRIYTLNIDDCLQNAFYHQKKKINIKSRNDRVNEYSFDNDITTLIKLNGDIDKPKEGYIFSPEEYANNINISNNWYTELAKDMFTRSFVFIGTKLNEPLLEYHLQKFKIDNNLSTSVKGYVITPSATEIEKLSLKNTNLEHIEGTLKDFIDYFSKEFNNIIPSHADILRKIKPYVIADDERLAKISKITPITNDFFLSQIDNVNNKTKSIKNFYKGFKPEWADIINEIPALLGKTEKFIKNISSTLIEANKVYVILGNAGSGKATVLKQVARWIVLNHTIPVYFIDNTYDSLREIVNYLDSINNTNYIICIDRIMNNKYKEIDELINESYHKASYIITENTKLWDKKGRVFLNHRKTVITDLTSIEYSDVKKILYKLQQYGSWTRFQRMSPKQRHDELWSKAKKQLLIGLLEATSGLGYNQIIEADFNSISSEDEKNLLLLASIPALENFVASEETLQRAMINLDSNFNTNLKKLTSNMNGTLYYKEGKISTRHRVYSKLIFECNTLENNFLVLKSYIKAFCVYQFPIVMNISKSEAEIYKQLVNFKFLNKFFNGDSSYVLNIYKEFEKELEHEGLFLMQYGLALRKYHQHLEAYETLIRSKDAFPSSPHIAHSLAQQKLILASIDISHSFNREVLFDEAKITLTNLSNVSIGDFKNDRYPIATLSRGHINFLIYKSQLEKAKEIAMSYYNEFSKFPEFKTDTYLQEISGELMKFSFTGKWNNAIDDWNF